MSISTVDHRTRTVARILGPYLTIVAFPETFAELANRTIDAAWVWRSVVVVLGVIGLYLTYVGWRPPSRAHDVTHEHRSTESRRAA